jgi:hypothetical protein
MAFRELRRIFALALCLLVALGMSTSAVQASIVPIKMATSMMSADVEPSQADPCGGCDHGDMKGASCATAFCAASAVATLPQILSFCRTDAPTAGVFVPARLSGWASAPQPPPPRPRDLG